MTHIDHGGIVQKTPLGFTLVELLITIAVASVLAAIAVPSFRTLMISNRLTTQAHEVVGAITYARSEAIRRNTSMTFCRAASTSATACSSGSSWQNWIIRTGTGTVVRRGRINTYGGTITTGSTLVSDQVVFGSDGLAQTGGAIVNDHEINVCAADGGTNNIRSIVLGVGSRLSTNLETGGC